MSDVPRHPVRVAIANDYPLVVQGVARVLAGYPDRVVVVQVDDDGPEHGDVDTDGDGDGINGNAPGTRIGDGGIDVVLYDTFGQQAQPRRLAEHVLAGPGARLVVFSWNTEPQLVERAIRAGAAGYLSKGIRAEDLVGYLERVHTGERVTPYTDEMPEGDTLGDHPGAAAHLSPREAEVLALVCRGLSDKTIARLAGISLSTVKTYLRSVYAKLEVESRTQALLWGLDHGFEYRPR